MGKSDSDGRGRRQGRPGGQPPEAPSLPGSLAQHLHDIGAGRRKLPVSGAVRHHYIAQMLLREFLDPHQPRERLWQLDKQTGLVTPQKPQAAASVRRLYRMEVIDGADPDHLEGFFAMVESHAAESLRRLRGDPAELDEGDRANISLLLSLQDLRTPAGQAKRLQQCAAAARSWLALPLSDQKRTNREYLNANPGATWDEAERQRIRCLHDLRDGRIGLEAPKELVFRLMLEMWLEISGVLHGLGWKLLHARDAEFVIGDRPLVMHDPTPKFPFSGNGFRSSPLAQTFMPLGPDLCVRMDQSSQRLAQRTVTRQVSLINLRSYGWSQRFVYGRDGDILKTLHEYATGNPDAVPAPRPDPFVFLEEADPDDPTVGQEHQAGYPKGLWVGEPDAQPRFMAYQLQYADDAHTVIIDDRLLGATEQQRQPTAHIPDVVDGAGTPVLGRAQPVAGVAKAHPVRSGVGGMAAELGPTLAGSW